MTRIRIAALLCTVLGLITACSSTDSSSADSAPADSSPGGAAPGDSSPTGSSPADMSSSGSASAASSPVVSATAETSSSAQKLPAGWSDDEVSFEVDGTTIHGTVRHPSNTAAKVPAALLIAGSGPTDRNGNSPGVPGSMSTLSNLAGALAADGVASLRYDKLGSGKTGLGAAAAHPDRIGLDVFTDEARAALAFLAARPGIEKKRLTVFGHSEGALFALLLATDPASAKSVHAIGLLEPLSKRYLDIIDGQVTAQLEQQKAAGAITDALAKQVGTALTKAIKQLRADGTVPDDMPGGLNKLFAPTSLKFLQEADRIDPAELAAKLPPTMPVLISCSDADIQVSCADVEHLAAATPKADLVHLTGVDHVLKEDDSKGAANYGKDLPFSHQLVEAVRTFVRR